MHTDGCLADRLVFVLQCLACGREPPKQRVYIDPGDEMVVVNSARRKKRHSSSARLAFKKDRRANTDRVHIVIPEGMIFEVKYAPHQLRRMIRTDGKSGVFQLQWKEGLFIENGVSVPLHLLRGAKLTARSAPPTLPLCPKRAPLPLAA